MKLDLKELISKILNTQPKDYIVEKGTSGTWTYRKWNSGIAECWGVWSSGGATGSAVNGWYCRVLGAISFPTNLFISAPKLIPSIYFWDTGYYFIGARDVSKTSFKLHIMKNGSGNASSNGAVYAIGQWK